MICGGGLLLSLLASGYAVKSKLGIDVFKSYSFSHALQVNNIVWELRRWLRPGKPADLIHDTFLWPAYSAKHAGFWARASAAARQTYGRTPDSGLPCLVVENNSPEDWAYKFFELFPVSAGEVFDIWGRFRTSPGVTASVSVVLYAPDGHVVDWNYARAGATGTQDWVVREREFVIPAGVDAIQFRLTGWGRGQTWFTEVRFRKHLKPSQPAP
jgi:hypothetical protein